MSPQIVLDANILVRAVLGKKVKNFLLDHYENINFYVPDICFEEAERYLPIILNKRALPQDVCLSVLHGLKYIIRIIDKDIYQEYEHSAKERIKKRDINDWPIVATAFVFNAPIWTEDQDFFGSGIPTWTTDRIHLFFKNCLPNAFA